MAALVLIQKSREELARVADVDYARLAAFIDGEGCIRIRRQRPPGRKTKTFHYDLELTVSNTDMRLLTWLRETFGGTVFLVQKVQYQPRRREGFYWRCRSSLAGYILERCFRFFIIKADQADTALGFQKLKIDWRRNLRFQNQPGVRKRREINRYVQELCHRVITKLKDSASAGDLQYAH